MASRMGAAMLAGCTRSSIGRTVVLPSPMPRSKRSRVWSLTVRVFESSPNGLTLSVAEGYSENSHASERLVSLRQGQVRGRVGRTGSLHAVLLLDLPEDRRYRWLRDQSRRGRADDEGDRQAIPRHLPRPSSG